MNKRPQNPIPYSNYYVKEDISNNQPQFYEVDTPYMDDIPYVDSGDTKVTGNRPMGLKNANFIRD